MVVYDFDANIILGLPLKNRQAKTLTNAWTQLHDAISRSGHTMKKFVLDNEISGELKAALTKYKYKFQLTPPNIHRINAAERAIRTYKNHLLSGLATCHPDFPIAEWDRLIDQANLTLNLLRTSRTNPKLSAYAYIFGQFDFNAHPLTPPGTKAIVHKKTGNRGSFAYHGVDGWTIGPSMDHYQCIKCYIPSTGATVDTDTLELLGHNLPIPKLDDKDTLHQALADVVHLLQHPQRTN